MAKFGWPVGHGARLREERREFAREKAGALAKSRMAEIEREQTGLTRRQTMVEAGKETQHKREYEKPGSGDLGGFRYAELAGKKKTGGARGGFTSSQMANLRKSAYGQAQTQYQAMEESGAFGDKKYSVDDRNKLIDMMASDLVNKYTSGGLPQAGIPEVGVPEPQGYGHVTTEGGRRWDIRGGEITRPEVEMPATTPAMEAAAYEPIELPETPRLRASFGRGEYDSGITSRNVFRKGTQVAKKGLTATGRGLYKKYLGLRKPTTGLDRYGQVFGR